MFPLLAGIIPYIADKIGNSIRGKNKIVDAGLDIVQNVVGHPVNSLTDVDYSKLTPEQITALKQADYGFYIDYNDKIVALAEQEVADRINARSTQVQTHSKMPATITIILTIGLFAIIWMIIKESTNLNQVEQTLLSSIIGMYIMKWGDSVSFFTGSSLASRSKDFIRK